MPELPEVEVTRRSLAPHIEGARVEALQMGKPLRWPLGVDPDRLVGTRIGTLVRRGKYIWVPLLRQVLTADAAPSSGDTAPAPPTPLAGGLLLHLGMSGSLRFEPYGPHRDVPPRGPHDHMDLLTDRGLLRLNDPRRFGAVVWAPSLVDEPAAALLGGLGKEPDDPTLTAQWFHAQLHCRRAPVKQLLLSGEIVVGAGNIYACEALFDAGIDPRTPGSRVSRPRAARLLAAVQATLAQALSMGGTTLRDFSDVHGMQGAFQHAAHVYGREGQPCHRCGTPIRRLVMGQRSTYFCPQCQRR